MDHEAYENQMFDGVNRSAGTKGCAVTFDEPVTTRAGLFTKTDASVVWVGIKRTILAILTTLLLAASVYGFVVVASVPGYLAVGLFFASIIGLLLAIIFVYAQGIAVIGSKGESK